MPRPTTTPITTLVRITQAHEALRWVPFGRTLRSWWSSGPRRLIAAWLLVSLVAVPSGMVTRWLEWTGIPLQLGGAQIHLTVYLPMLFCLPLMLWLGYWWAAIPAYLSTFCVAWIGGMPPLWIPLFALANPMGLAALHLAYRAFPMRPDLRSAPALLYFALMVFISSVIGSAGSFVWAYTNGVGLNQFYPVWQGWWLGGAVQAMVVVAPLLMLATPTVERWKDRLGVPVELQTQQQPAWIISVAAMLVAAIATYVLVVRWFIYSALAEAMDGAAASDALRGAVDNAVAGLVLPQWVLLALVSVTLLFGYRVGLQWSTEYKALARDLERANLKLQRTAATDALTGIPNRFSILETLPKMVSRARRREEPLACLLFDLDRFKSINDRYGHLAGDEVLKRVAQICADRLRQEDLFARFGGEEFLVLVERANTEVALALAEELRGLVAGLRFEFGSERVQVTTSIGVAELADVPSGDPVNHLLALADLALYRAKANGRNRVVAAHELEVAAPA